MGDFLHALVAGGYGRKRGSGSLRSDVPVRTVCYQAGLSGRIKRCDNVKDVKLYIENIDEMIERKRKLFEEE